MHSHLELSHLAIHLVVVVLLVLVLLLLVGATSTKSPRFRRFKSDRDEISQEWSLCKYASIELTKSDFDLTLIFLNGGHDVTSRTKVLYCHLVSENEASATRICSRAREYIRICYRPHAGLFRRRTGGLPNVECTDKVVEFCSN